MNADRVTSELEETLFDAVIIGGGVLGAVTAWDASLRGLRVALVERGRFGAGTSANSLRILHGGLRYLTRLDLPRMRASLAERAAWLRIAPHLVDPLPVLVPLGRGPGRAVAARAAVTAANLLSLDRNRELHSGHFVPPARVIGPEACRALVPELAGAALGAGGILFQDGLLRDPEQLVRELVQGAVAAGAVAAEGVTVDGPLLLDGRRIGVLARTAHGDRSIEVRAGTIVNTSGAGCTPLSRALAGQPAGAPGPRPSIALNIVLPDGEGRSAGPEVAAPGGRAALALSGVFPDGTRRLLRVPWQGRILVGTMHLPVEESELPRSVEHPAVRILLDAYNAAWPGTPVEPDEVLEVQAGRLPTRHPDSDPGTGAPRLAARGRIRFVATGGGAPVLQAETVNFTLARRVAEDVVDRICRVVRTGVPDCATAYTPLPTVGYAQPSTLRALARVAPTRPAETVQVPGPGPGAPPQARNDRGAVALRSWLVDAHVHLYPDFDPERSVRGLLRNLTRAAATRPESLEGACLLLAATPGEPPLEVLLEGGGLASGLPHGWVVGPTQEPESLRLEGSGGDHPLLLVDGVQLQTTGGIEILGLCLDRKRAGALVRTPADLPESVAAIREMGGFPVIPWGFGKWWGRRGREVARFVHSQGPDAPPLALGDNGNRLAGSPRPPLFVRGEERGIPVLPGSDPLPLPHHAGRIGSAGFVLTGPLDPERPAATIRWTLSTLTGSPSPFGSRAPLLDFVRDQSAMQRRKERRG